MFRKTLSILTVLFTGNGIIWKYCFLIREFVMCNFYIMGMIKVQGCGVICGAAFLMLSALGMLKMDVQVSVKRHYRQISFS